MIANNDIFAIATITIYNIIIIFLISFIFIITRNTENNNELTEIIVYDKNKEDIMKLLKDRIVYESSPDNNEITLIRDKPNVIDWKFICINASNKNVIELLKDNRDKIDWNELSGNDSAIDLVKERIEYEKGLSKEEYGKLSKINWKKLSGNGNAIEQLKERIEYEKMLTAYEYYNLDDISKIDWYILTQNANAVELLKANTDKIDWRFLASLLE